MVVFVGTVAVALIVLFAWSLCACAGRADDIMREFFSEEEEDENDVSV